MINQQISRHACDPSAECAVNFAITSQRPVDAQENFLRKVLGLLPVTCESVAEVENAPRVATHKFLPGRTVTAKALLDQLSFWFQ